jgi:Activator of Hsp90 ATPase homolog 1-like protein
MNTPDVSLSPLRHAVVVELEPHHAFALFTGRLDAWWPLAQFSCSGEAKARVEVQPRVGGQVLEQGADGRAHAWGRVTAWDPPRAFAMSWHPGQDAALATDLRVEFRALADGRCEVSVIHGGWDRRPDARAGYDQGWPVVLAAYAAAAVPVRA